MEVFGIVMVMLLGLFVGGYATILTALVGMWHSHIGYQLTAFAAFIITIAFEIFIFTSYFTLGLQ